MCYLSYPQLALRFPSSKESVMFTRIKIIKGKPYRYNERRWREGGKVRSESTYLGPEHPHMAGAERAWAAADKMQVETFGQTAQQAIDAAATASPPAPTSLEPSAPDTAPSADAQPSAPDPSAAEGSEK